jgi:hypothetical protein
MTEAFHPFSGSNDGIVVFTIALYLIEPSFRTDIQPPRDPRQLCGYCAGLVLSDGAPSSLCQLQVVWQTKVQSQRTAVMFTTKKAEQMPGRCGDHLCRLTGFLKCLLIVSDALLDGGEIAISPLNLEEMIPQGLMVV